MNHWRSIHVSELTPKDKGVETKAHASSPFDMAKRMSELLPTRPPFIDQDSCLRLPGTIMPLYKHLHQLSHLLPAVAPAQMPEVASESGVILEVVTSFLY